MVQMLFFDKVAVCKSTAVKGKINTPFLVNVPL